MNRILVCGPKSEWFCDKLGKKLELEPIFVEHKKFPDGETYIRIPEETTGKKVIIAQSTPYPQDKSIWELLLMIEAVTHHKPEKIILYTPYIAYSRQDKIFREGEPISIKLLLQTLSLAGATKLVTIDIHKPETLAYFRGPAINVIPVKTLSQKIREYTENPLILAPDKGALNRAKQFAKELESDHDYLEKQRDRITGEIQMKTKTIPVKNRDVVIVDDIIATGGTVAKAARMLYEQGAEKIIVAVSHALLAGNAIEKLGSADIKKIIAANTLPPKSSVEYIDVSSEIVDHLL